MRGEIPPSCAAHGMVSDGGTRIFMYAGMLEYGRYSDEFYELQATRWEWKKVKVKPPPDEYPPVPRIGNFLDCSFSSE